jgi:uncharacterized membrane protein HdeD (DUF308 family)
MNNSIAMQQLAAKWWTFLVHGIVALAIAAYAFTSLGGTATALAYVVAAYFIVGGIAAVAAGISFRGIGHWFAAIPLGIVQAALGVCILSVPDIDPVFLAHLFALWMITSSVAELSATIAMRNIIQNEFWLGLLGIPGLAIGCHFVVRPDLGLLALVYTIGFYGVLAGVSLIGFAFRIKGTGANFVAPSRSSLRGRSPQSQRSARPRPSMCSVLSLQLISNRSRTSAKKGRRR